MTNRIEVYRGGGVPESVLNQMTPWESPEELREYLQEKRTSVGSINAQLNLLSHRWEYELDNDPKPFDRALAARRFAQTQIVVAKASYREWLAQNHLCELKDFESLQVRVSLLEERLAQLERGREAE